ncbi:MAG: UDP-N-acetylmuramoyl-L-alanine--D-glutamate ligase, partial [Emcibacteraceae bacterium]|nr:UDP-N-acetylmuramoyl-L-alanine--D-glutamate ligase [Emcibacteraceae bacterium]
MHLSDLENKKIAIWGMGLEGQTTLSFLQHHFPKKDFLIINRELVEDVDHFIFEKNIEENMDNFDVVIKSPGISFYHSIITKMEKHGIIVTSATNIWFALKKSGTVIAITGSNGKSTTSALLHHILKETNLNAQLGGNIGMPLLSLPLDADYHVVELSSYQTCDLKYAPDISVILNLHPEHIHWHKSHEQYYHDKCNLLRRGADINIVNGLDPQLNNIKNVIYFNDSEQIHSKNKTIFDGNFSIGETKSFPLLGEHNLENLCAVLTIAKKLELDLDECLKASFSFSSLPHRLQILGPYNGITYINDSISTDPEATIAALNVLSGKTIALIIGGEDRHQDFNNLCSVINRMDKVSSICIYETGPRLFDQITSFDKHMAIDLEDAVKIAREKVNGSGYILLSPASPSYDAFKDFTDRGSQFIKFALN